MFSFKKKSTKQTPVEELPPSRSAVEALRTVDGGYMGPGSMLDEPPLDRANQRKDYQSTKRAGGDAASNIPTLGQKQSTPRRSSTLNYLNESMGAPGAHGKLYANHPDDVSMYSSAGSTVKKQKCCNPDHGMCGGCCYPFTCFGFSENQNLVVVAAGLLLILAGLIVGIVVLLLTVMRSQEICNTKECIVAAGEIISSLDEAVNPCDDFVQFSCGGWKRNHPVPAGMGGYDYFSQLQDTTHFRLKELLEEPSGPGDIKPVNITRAFYAACANESAWEETGLAPLLVEIGKSGGYPMINASWTKTSFNWIQSIVFMRRMYAADYLLGVGVTYDAKNSSVFAIHLGEGYIPSPREFILSSEPRYRMMELNRILTIAKMLSIDTSGALVVNNGTAPSTTESTSRLKQEPLLGEDEDIALERVFKEMENKEKMQMRRKETVITLDGIAPDMRILDKLKMSQLEPDAETVVVSSRQTSQMDTDANDLYQFIYELANITMSSEEAGDQYAMYNPMTISDLQKRTDALGSSAAKIDWLMFFNSIFRAVNVTLTAKERIIVGSPGYVDGLLRLLYRTPGRVVANFLSYMLVLNLGEEAASSFMSLRGAHGPGQDNMPRYIGRSEVRPWYDCSAKANLFLGNAVGYLYLKTSFSDDTLMKTREMVSDVHASFRTIMETADWMDEETRVAGLQKLDAMLQLVGHSEDSTNVTRLEQQYKELPALSTTAHFSNVLLLAQYLSKQSLVNYKETPKRDVFSMNPVTINAAYSFSQNAMLIPAGILQPPFYRMNTMTALNYGAIGVVIGHEVSHGFDDAGKEVDDKGNLRQWWTNTSKQTYHDKAECFVEQYGNYPTEDDLKGDEKELLGYKINGMVTQGENIADNGGIQAAWRAFQMRTAANKEDPRLPGLEKYTDEQLFFISFAQLWCTNYTPQGLKGAIMLGPHAPGPYRVKGCFHNIKQMRDAFQCPRDTSSGFNQTCSLW